MLVNINWIIFLGRNREFWDQFLSKLQEKMACFLSVNVNHKDKED
jgi:hypothetical protein